MKIYSKEKADGITTLGNSIAYCSLAEFSNNIPFDLEKLDLAKATNNGQIDLHYLKTILVSVGWNKNDDVFAPEEVWEARHSAEDKPFDYEHNLKDIIGHITSSQPVDAEYKLIADDTSIDELPEKFHILTQAVLYKQYGDEELKKRALNLINEINQGKWYVSMEALFTDFDYAVVYPDSTKAVIERNSKTAFLTKHLRAYGGDGTYENAKIGRVLRNIVFSGKGLVKKPANPESIIFGEASLKEFSTSDSSLHKNFQNPVYTLSKEIEMSDKLQETVDKLTKDIESKDKELKDTVASKDSLQKKVDETTALLEKAELTLKSKDEEIAKVQAQVKTSTDELVKAKTELEAIKADLTKANENFNKVNREYQHIKRVELVKDELGLDKTEAEAFMKDLEIEEKAFAEMVKKVKTLNIGKKGGHGGFETNPDNLTEKKSVKSSETEKTKAENLLEKAETEPTPALGSGSEEVDSVRAEIREFLKVQKSKKEIA